MNRQNYLDINIADVQQSKTPICQLKYDGIWACARADSKSIRYYSRNNQLKRTDLSTATPGIYIGELMYGSEWSKDPTRQGRFFCFDLVELEGQDYKDFPYEYRYMKLTDLFNRGRVPNYCWTLVTNFHTHEKDKIWQAAVLTEEFEGLVFRNPLSSWYSTLFRAKYQLEADLKIVDFEPGQGRLSNTLGALVCTDGKLLHNIGGGFTDAQRKHIWDNRQSLIDKMITITAKKKFDSGLFRHPNFKCFHNG